MELAEGTKTAGYKKSVISHFIENGPTTITELAKVLSLSIPTVTKVIGDLSNAKCVRTYGKLETQGGRYPQLYGLNPTAGYFVGVDLKHSSVNLGLIDFVGDIQNVINNVPYELDDTTESLDQLCVLIEKFIEDSGFKKTDILNININLPGRINPELGLSLTHFSFVKDSKLTDEVYRRLCINVTIDNDTRGMTYGEFTQGYAKDKHVKNVLYVNMSWGVGLGLILNGRVFKGKSGFSGEFGHISAFDNQIICQCGKKGCLETEVSGRAMQSEIMRRIRSGEASILSKRVLTGHKPDMEEIIEATLSEDVLCLEILGEIGNKLGKHVSSLINIFNPELVIIGGSMSRAGETLTDAVKSVVRTYSLNVVTNDTEIVTALQADNAGVLGACMLARVRRFS